ncbi:hypothetical protein F8388_000263 [Cannabis sativa]|uniref:RNase H type-1 domain-containing protein n=1 Tax=Cannabis sativa TaxID=3483 RepID=A0A7J6FN55_CANSA|nr:hypothetical protein F8388_000263 [Cannabis sativa]
MLHNFSPKSLDIIEVVTTLQQGNKMIKDHTGPIRWKPPEVGNLVVDAALDDQMKTNSSGGIIRDHLGSVIHSFYTFLSHTVNPLLAELRAIEEGLLWANRVAHCLAKKALNVKASYF